MRQLQLRNYLTLKKNFDFMLLFLISCAIINFDRVILFSLLLDLSVSICSCAIGMSGQVKKMSLKLW